MSRSLLITVLTLLVVSVALAQGPPPAAPHVSISRFGGLVDNDPNSTPLGNALDMMNLDIIQTASSLSIEKRRGFDQLGLNFDGDVWGLYVYAPSSEPSKIVAVANQSIYEYDDVQDRFRQLATNTLAGTCAVTAGSDTIRGINSLWWELTGYDLDSIRIQDTDSTRSKAIRHILSDSVLIIEGTWLGATNASRACTLKTNTGSPDVGSAVSFSTAGETYGDMLLDTLLITGPANRVRYASRNVEITSSPVFDSVRFGYANEYSRWQRYMGVYGDVPPGAGDWWQLMKKLAPGTNQWRRVSLRKMWSTSGYVQFAVDTIIEQMFDAGTTEAGKWKILPAADTTFNQIVFKATVVGFDIDTITKTGCGVADLYRITHTITSTSVANSPQNWPIDSLNGLTVLAKSSGGAFIPCKYRIPVSLVNLEGDTTAIRFVQYPIGGCNTSMTYFATGDSIILVADNYGGDNLSAVDSLHVESWEWPVQFMWHPTRLAYFGNSNESVDSLGYSAIKILKALEIDDDSTDQIFTVAQDDGRRVSAAINVGDYVYVHKGGEEIYQIAYNEIGRGGQIVSTNTGFSALHQKGVGQWRGHMVYITAQGLWADVGAGAQRLSNSIDNYWQDSIASGAVVSSRLKVFDNKAYVSYRRSGQAANDRTLIYDFLTGQWYKYSFGFGESCIYPNELSEDSLLFASPFDVDSGAVFIYGRTDSDTGIVSDSYYRTGWFPVENTMSLYDLSQYSVTRWLGYGDTLQFKAWNDYGASTVASDNISVASAAAWAVTNRFINTTRLGAVWSFQIGSDINADSLRVSSLELDFTRRSMRPRR